jgi:hypothetical protein
MILSRIENVGDEHLVEADQNIAACELRVTEQIRS